MDAVLVMEWVERLGGWGVVVFIVRWMLDFAKEDRKDNLARMQSLQTSFQKAVEGFSTSINTFEAFERSQQGMNQQILEKLDTSSLKSAVTNFDATVKVLTQFEETEKKIHEAILDKLDKIERNTKKVS